jgi:hypothetical protein
MGKPQTRSLAAELSKVIASLPSGAHLGRGTVRALIARHHGIEFEAPTKPGPKPRRKRAEAQPDLDAALPPPAPPAPSTARKILQEVLAKQREGHDRFGNSLGVPGKDSRGR